MAEITLKGNPVHTVGDLPEAGTTAPAFEVTGADLSPITLADFAGSAVVLNVFPSIDTGVCAASVRAFNEKAAGLDNTKVLCISRDLPFALSRFCGAEGIDNVITASDFRTGFGETYGLTFADGPLRGLLSRCVIVIDANATIVHTEQVAEITTEPDYDAALRAIS